MVLRSYWHFSLSMKYICILYAFNIIKLNSFFYRITGKVNVSQGYSQLAKHFTALFIKRTTEHYKHFHIWFDNWPYYLLYLTDTLANLLIMYFEVAWIGGLLFMYPVKVDQLITSMKKGSDTACGNLLEIAGLLYT